MGKLPNRTCATCGEKILRHQPSYDERIELDNPRSQALHYHTDCKPLRREGIRARFVGMWRRRRDD